MDIDMIEVVENNINFIIFPKQKKVLIDNSYYQISEEEILEFIKIIRNWDSEYIGNSYLDGNKFLVKVHYDGKVDQMMGVRKAPENYADFVKFVRSIYDRR